LSAQPNNKPSDDRELEWGGRDERRNEEKRKNKREDQITAHKHVTSLEQEER
jgi:hypothetical protein